MKFPQIYHEEMIAIDQLKIDRDNYQREEQGSHVQYIAEAFNPLAFGAATVGRRKNGENYIVDGQQRTLAAKIAGYDAVPCLVFRSDGSKQEAQLFNDINKYRKRVTPLEVFRAALTAGNTSAVNINKAATKAGFQIATNPSPKKLKWPYIQAISTIEKIYKSGGTAALEMTLELITTIWPNDEDAIREVFLNGFWSFVDCSRDVLDRSILMERMKGHIPAKLLREADKQSTLKSIKQYRAVQMELIKIYNRGTKKKIT